MLRCALTLAQTPTFLALYVQRESRSMIELVEIGRCIGRTLLYKQICRPLSVVWRWSGSPFLWYTLRRHVLWFGEPISEMVCWLRLLYRARSKEAPMVDYPDDVRESVLHSDGTKRMR